ncbi:CotH kinase family protein [Fervidobacterium nodosum]|uniref:Spore coat protein CotH n=1 Tax=Fervidobacterium nodosum (strain ATCC 35602 / DSM 5306 / Rt17-B1) TaxID=381764 RepID=A7HNE2_FERNB|nr:CotH kinase family protein [Fervidobacterium nodosum]ABS61425.1 Spore coat protein CotH [Fervidobacterium nodosum Rt17-B1]
MKKILLLLAITILCFLSVSLFSQLLISHESGFYDITITVEIKSTVGGEIYYTIDGSTPRIDSKNTFKYSQPLVIQKNYENEYMYIPTSPIWEKPSGTFEKATVLRVIEVSNGNITDSTVRTYFIGVNHKLPVFSIITDPENLFDDEKGIYVPGKLFDPSNPFWTGNYQQRGDTSERPAIMEYFEEGKLKYRTEIGIRIHGEFTRSLPIKSLRLYARNKEKEFRYPFFGRIGYKKLLLRNAGNDWETAYMRDVFTQRLFKNLNFDTQDNYSVVHYINGEYWGISYLMEYYDQRYLQVKYGVNEKNTVIINYDLTIQDGKEGDQKSFLDLMDFVRNNDLSIKENYDKVCEMIDIDNFIDFKIAEILSANTDWLGNNERIWRVLKPENNKYGDGKWRWMMYDMDLAMWDPTHDTLKTAIFGDPEIPWTTTEEATLILKKLLENEEFRAKFTERFYYILNNIFIPELAESIADDIIGKLNDEMKRHSQRWGKPTYEAWQNESEWVKKFVEYRRDIIRSIFEENFIKYSMKK